MAKQAKESETGMVKVVDPSPARDAAAVPSVPTFGQRVGRFFRFLLRLVALLVILGVIGLGLYFGLPLLYQRYVVPVEQNTAGVTELQSQQRRTAQEMADLQTKLQTLETVQNQHDESLKEVDKRLNEIETEVSARTESLAAIEKIQSDLQKESEASSAELQRQLDLLKAMELLSRARLFMYQSNFGLARQDVQIARNVLAEVQVDAPESLADDLDEVVRRLDLTLFNLPDFPVAAEDDLDIAWQVLLSGLPAATPTVSGTVTPAGTLSATPTVNTTFTPTPRATGTVRVTGTVRPSATP